MGTWPVLTPDDLDLTLDTWDLTQTLSDTLGDLGTPADGFDSYLNDTITLLAGLGDLGGSLLDDLNLATAIAGTIDPTSLNSDAASLPATLAAGDAIVADANALLGSVGPPPPPSGGGGGGAGGGPSPNCGRHGQSRIGTFDYHLCDLLITLPIASVADGPCPSEFALQPALALNAPPANFVSIALTSGDSALWTVGHRTGQQADGTRQDYWTVTVNPTTPGHYDAKATMVQTQPSATVHICMSVDVIA